MSTNTSMIADLLIRGSSRYASLACLSEINESLYGQTTSAVRAYAVILLGTDADVHHSSGVPDIETPMILRHFSCGTALKRAIARTSQHSSSRSPSSRSRDALNDM